MEQRPVRYSVANRTRSSCAGGWRAAREGRPVRAGALRGGKLNTQQVRLCRVQGGERGGGEAGRKFIGGASRLQIKPGLIQVSRPIQEISWMAMARSVGIVGRVNRPSAHPPNHLH